MIIQRRQPTEKDLENLGKFRAMTGSGRSPGSGIPARPAHSKEEDTPDPGLKDSGSTPEQCRSSQDPKEQLTEEERKIRRNDRDREARLKRMQDRLEVVNELREAGFLIHRINY